MGFGTERAYKHLDCKLLHDKEQEDATSERGNSTSVQLRKSKIVASIMSFIISLEVIVQSVFVALVATGGIEPPTLVL